MDKRGILRFIRYTSVGVSTFLFDLALLYVAVSYAGVPYYLATPGAYFVAVSINYTLSRLHVFKGSKRSWHHGYLYFAVMAIAGSAATTTLVSLLVSLFGLYYLLARIIVAGIVGIGNYLFNLHFNFRLAGKH